MFSSIIELKTIKANIWKNIRGLSVTVNSKWLLSEKQILSIYSSCCVNVLAPQINLDQIRVDSLLKL